MTTETTTVEVFSRRAQGGPLYCVKHNGAQVGAGYLTHGEAAFLKAAIDATYAVDPASRMRAVRL